jgi:hypothetical protein
MARRLVWPHWLPATANSSRRFVGGWWKLGSVFLIGGARSKVKARSGPTAQHLCAECGRITAHRPVSVRDGFHLFFVEIGSHDSAGYQCVECGEVVAADQVQNILGAGADDAATELEDLGAARADQRAQRALAAPRPAADGTPAAAAPDAGAAAADVLRAIHGTVAGLPRVDDPGGIRTPRHRPAAIAVDDDRLERELAALKARRPR